MCGELVGFKMSLNSMGISILQYADDTLVMVGGSFSQACVVKDFLLRFELFSDLKVNASKTLLYEVNIVLDWELILDLWGRRKYSFPYRYLGMSLGANSLCISLWYPLYDRIKCKHALWKRHYLSKGGR